jgi:cytochrome-b5 reductase
VCSLLAQTYDLGNISKHVAQLKIGQKIRVKGPKGQFNYSPGLVRALGMLAGGTGITPMFQIIQAIAKNPADKTQVRLIYANVAPEDILLKKELDALAASRPGQIEIFYVLNKPAPGWTGGEGFVSQEHIKTHLPPTADDIKILLCGPPPMNTAMKYGGLLLELGLVLIGFVGNTLRISVTRHLARSASCRIRFAPQSLY